MYCKECGIELDDNSKYCWKCGSEISKFAKQDSISNSEEDGRNQYNSSKDTFQSEKDKKESSRNKLILILSIIIPIILISITFGVLSMLGIFSKEEKKEVTEAKAEDIPELKVGNIISIEKVEVYIPPETQDSQPDIAISEVTEPVPPPKEDVTAVGKVYEITSEGELAGQYL
jgi:uncharacterized membrane protein YvbJ